MSTPFVSDELVQLQKEITSKNPVDVLQFCANYFNTKLELQRAQLWQQQNKAKAAGIVLFSKTDNVSVNASGNGASTPNGRQPSFKSPFGDNDPHLIHEQHHEDDPTSEVAPDSVNTGSISAGIFRSQFGGNGGLRIQNPVDPSDPNDRSHSPGPASFNSFGAGPSSPSSKGPDSLGPGPTGSAAPTSAPAPTSGSGAARRLPIAFNANRRTSVSAEALNPGELKAEDWKPPRNDLSPSQKSALNRTLASNFLFKQLDESSKHTVIEALSEKKFQKDVEIITQGDEGDFFYIIESGTVDFYVNGSKVSSSGPGSSFGELALMYNSPRAATATASSDGGVTCWALDRSTFRRILLQGTFNRRLMYEDFLKDVKVLSGLTDHERSKLADALLTEIYQKGDKIVTEGENGENFYFIESGTCQVLKEKEGVLTKLSKGDYFGEIALLNDLPRQATVEALDTVIVATLDKSGFSRLLGPAVEVLKSQDPTASRDPTGN